MPVGREIDRRKKFARRLPAAAKGDQPLLSVEYGAFRWAVGVRQFDRSPLSERRNLSLFEDLDFCRVEEPLGSNRRAVGDRRRQIADRDGFADRDGADRRPPQFGHHGFRSDGPCQVAAEAADIRAAAANDLAPQPGIIEFQEPQGVDAHSPRSEDDRFAAAGDSVGATALNLDGGIGGRHLLDHPHESRQSVFELLAGGKEGIGNQLKSVFDIVGIAGRTEPEGRLIGLGERLQPGRQPRRRAERDDEQPAGDRVERSRVTAARLRAKRRTRSTTRREVSAGGLSTAIKPNCEASGARGRYSLHAPQFELPSRRFQLGDFLVDPL